MISLLGPVQRALLGLAIVIGVIGAAYLWGRHDANEAHEAAELQKKVRDLVLVDTINQLDNQKMVEQQNEIERLRKEVENGRTKIRDGACFDAGDVDQLRNAWR